MRGHQLVLAFLSFTKGLTMAKQLVLIDNCVLNFLHARNVDLLAEQGDDLTFNVSDLGWLEIPKFDTDKLEAREVGEYARDQLARLQAEPVQWFTFGDLDNPSAGKGGYGELMPDGTVKGGGYLGDLAGKIYREDPTQHKKIGGESGTKRTNSGLLRNETDVDYGEWAMNFPVVTDNGRDFKKFKNVIMIRDWGDVPFGIFIRQKLTSSIPS
jgi:hypothetical protein